MKELLLVFPIRFELSKFLLELSSKIHSISHLDDISLVELSVNDKKTKKSKKERDEMKGHRFYYYVADESDIMFLLKVNQLFSTLPISNYDVLIIGSCGLHVGDIEFKTLYKSWIDEFKSKLEPINVEISKLDGKDDKGNRLTLEGMRDNILKDHNELLRLDGKRIDFLRKHLWNECFYVSTAFKYDRGVNKNNILQIRIDKILECKIPVNTSLKLLCSESKLSINEIRSTNQLITHLPDSKENGSRLFDMETYDFFKLCDFRGVSCLGALRVVSDIIDDDESKATRVLLSMSKATDIIIEYVKSSRNQQNFLYDQVSVLKECGMFIINQILDVISKNQRNKLIHTFYKSYKERNGCVIPGIYSDIELQLIQLLVKLVATYEEREELPDLNPNDGPEELDDSGNYYTISYIIGGVTIEKDFVPLP